MLRAKTIKILRERIGVNLHDFGLSNGFLDMTLKVKATKGKIDWISAKLKLLCFM